MAGPFAAIEAFGLILAYGYDALWYPVCYTAGYLILLVVVAAPLRRSGAPQPSGSCSITCAWGLR